MGERHTRQGVVPSREVTQVRGPDEYEDRDWPARKSTTGGTQHVTASDVLSAHGCWCGDPLVGHDWPGKTEGQPHPR